MVARYLFTALALLASSSALVAAEEPEKSASAIVLCYHIVENPADTRFAISPETFRQQMQYLASSGFNVISLADLQSFVAGEKDDIPPNAVVITIDDGWRSTYTEVYPELKEFRFPFTVFIYPKFIGQGANALTWNQVREMADDGVDIQSHTFSHAFLTHRKHSRLDDKSYHRWLRSELADSKKAIEAEVGREVSFLAYPYGDYDSRVALVAGEVGYDAAVTCDYGKVVRGSDPLKMKRVIIDRNTTFESFRRSLGVGSMILTSNTPLSGKVFDKKLPIVSARLPEFMSFEPASVGMAVVSMGPTPYSYDPRNGTISLIVREPLKENVQRVVVWANRKSDGRRVEASWSFYLKKPPPPAPVVARKPVRVDPVVPPPAPIVGEPATLEEPATAGEMPASSPTAMRQPRR
ncbi:MAG TPA: polysaccharide deacetylase family protein [Thermoanaerobaculia bacterium]|nr:polysaccharide deacetylase family protein [Thermoanaerobaculia bacterium]